MNTNIHTHAEICMKIHKLITATEIDFKSNEQIDKHLAQKAKN